MIYREKRRENRSRESIEERCKRERKGSIARVKYRAIYIERCIERREERIEEEK